MSHCGIGGGNDNLGRDGNWRGRTRIGQERVPNEIVEGGAIRFIEARTTIYQPTRGLQNRAAVVVRVNCNKGRGVMRG